MPSKIFLAAMGLVFAGYGLMCLFVPGTVADATGMGLTSEVAEAEVRAMYGGLQFAVGALALSGAVRPELERTALISLCFLFAGLAGGRLFAILLASDPGGYNYAACAFEAASLAVAFLLLRRSPQSAGGLAD
jgi:hypothetical protein